MACEVAGMGMPSRRKSLSARAYTMHTVPMFLHITDRLLPGEIEQIAALGKISTKIVQDISIGKRPIIGKLGEKVLLLIRLRLRSSEHFYDMLNSNYFFLRPHMTYEEMLSLLREADYDIIASAFRVTYIRYHKPEEVRRRLSKETYNSESCSLTRTARLRAESNLQVEEQFEYYFKQKCAKNRGLLRLQ